MKRVMFSLASVLVLVAALAVTALAQESYPSQQQQQQPTTTDQSTTPATTDPATTSSTTSTEPMPATASPLPLIGLGGLASLAAGAWVTRRRRK